VYRVWLRSRASLVMQQRRAVPAHEVPKAEKGQHQGRKQAECQPEDAPHTVKEDCPAANQQSTVSLQTRHFLAPLQWPSSPQPLGHRPVGAQHKVTDSRALQAQSRAWTLQRELLLMGLPASGPLHPGSPASGRAMWLAPPLAALPPLPWSCC
jgi:hypothetical protein